MYSLLKSMDFLRRSKKMRKEMLYVCAGKKAQNRGKKWALGDSIIMGIVTLMLFTAILI